MMQAWADYLDRLRSRSKLVGRQDRARAGFLNANEVSVESSL
jgi:hypothetical protein